MLSSIEQNFSISSSVLYLSINNDDGYVERLSSQFNGKNSLLKEMKLQVNGILKLAERGQKIIEENDKYISSIMLKMFFVSFF